MKFPHIQKDMATAASKVAEDFRKAVLLVTERQRKQILHLPGNKMVYFFNVDQSGITNSNVANLSADSLENRVKMIMAVENWVLYEMSRADYDQAPESPTGVSIKKKPRVNPPKNVFENEINKVFESLTESTKHLSANFLPYAKPDLSKVGVVEMANCILSTLISENDKEMVPDYQFFWKYTNSVIDTWLHSSAEGQQSP
jgi:hypothetical protein